ncbi:MAG: site-specific integrase [Bdellovibrionaceae bacterium]|nr:site-specific integrase [Pseudobdellovibrionaceae bacterium]
MAIKKVIENGKPKYEVIVKIRDKSGKQIMKRKRWFNNEREARRIELELLMDLESFKTKVTWQKWIEHVLEKYRIEYRTSTYFNYKHCLNKWFDPVWNEKFMDDIKPSDVHQVIFERCKETSSYTQRGLLKIVKRVFNIAIEEGLLVRNPAVGIRVKCADANQAILNRNEIEILLQEARNSEHRFFPHWTLALLTGMRSGELYSLRWTDVDLVTGKINISKAWTKCNGEGPTKTAKNRIYPISNEGRKFLVELQTRYCKNSEFVLPRLWEWDQGEQAKVLKSFCTDIGITPVKFHDLRATFITQMLNNGVPLSKVMAIVGHSSLKTTQGYLRLSGKDIEGATEGLNIEVPQFEEHLDNVVALRKR